MNILIHVLTKKAINNPISKDELDFIQYKFYTF